MKAACGDAGCQDYYGYAESVKAAKLRWPPKSGFSTLLFSWRHWCAIEDSRNRMVAHCFLGTYDHAYCVKWPAIGLPRLLPTRSFYALAAKCTFIRSLTMPVVRLYSGGSLVPSCVCIVLPCVH